MEDKLSDSQFDTFVWKGQTRYRCTGKWESGVPCSFDTHDKELLIKHMATPHLRTLPDARIAPPIPTPAPLAASGTEQLAAEFKDARFADVDDTDS